MLEKRIREVGKELAAAVREGNTLRAQELIDSRYRLHVEMAQISMAVAHAHERERLAVWFVS